MSEKIRGLGQMHIGGKLRPFQVNGIRQANAFCEALGGIELDEYWNKVAQIATGGILTSQEITIAFIYSALFAGAKKERLPIDFTYDDVLDWVEDADDSEAEEIAKPLTLWVKIINAAAAKAEKEQKPKKA